MELPISDRLLESGPCPGRRQYRCAETCEPIAANRDLSRTTRTASRISGWHIASDRRSRPRDRRRAREASAHPKDFVHWLDFGWRAYHGAGGARYQTGLA